MFNKRVHLLVKRILMLLKCTVEIYIYIYTVFARVICALFFSILAAEKSGCVKYADFFCGGLDLGFILV